MFRKESKLLRKGFFKDVEGELFRYDSEERFNDVEGGMLRDVEI